MKYFFSKIVKIKHLQIFSYRDLTWQKPLNNGGSALTQYRVERKCITTKKDWETIIETKIVNSTIIPKIRKRK